MTSTSLLSAADTAKILKDAEDSRASFLESLKRERSEDPDDRRAREEDNVIAGPIDQQNCFATGPGMAGGPINEFVFVSIQARDANSVRIKTGGEQVTATLNGKDKNTHSVSLELDVSDQNDGTYKFCYSVPCKGYYQLHIEINGIPLGGSPFPLFFSSAAEVKQDETKQAPNMDMQYPQQTSATDEVPPSIIVQKPQDALLEAGTNIIEQRQKTPSREEMQRMVFVGDLAPSVSAEQLKSLLSLCGTIASANIHRGVVDVGIVEFETSTAAKAALALNGMSVIDKQIRIIYADTMQPTPPPQLAAIACSHSSNPAMNDMQMAAVNAATTSLAQQVAAMRAQTRMAALKASHDLSQQRQKAMDAAMNVSKYFKGRSSRRSRSRSPDSPEPVKSSSDKRKRSEPRKASRRSRSRSSDSRSVSRSRSRSRSRERHRSKQKSRYRRDNEHRDYDYREYEDRDYDHRDDGRSHRGDRGGRDDRRRESTRYERSSYYSDRKDRDRKYSDRRRDDHRYDRRDDRYHRRDRSDKRYRRDSPY